MFTLAPSRGFCSKWIFKVFFLSLFSSKLGLVSGEFDSSDVLICFSWTSGRFMIINLFSPSLPFAKQNRRAKCRKHENQLHKGEKKPSDLCFWLAQEHTVSYSCFLIFRHSVCSLSARWFIRAHVGSEWSFMSMGIPLRLIFTIKIMFVAILFIVVIRLRDEKKKKNVFWDHPTFPLSHAHNAWITTMARFRFELSMKLGVNQKFIEFRAATQSFSLSDDFRLSNKSFSHMWMCLSCPQHIFLCEIFV